MAGEMWSGDGCEISFSFKVQFFLFNDSNLCTFMSRGGRCWMAPEIPCLFSVMNKCEAHFSHTSIKSILRRSGTYTLYHKSLSMLKIGHPLSSLMSYIFPHPIPSHIHIETQTHMYIQRTLHRQAGIHSIGVHIYVHTCECIPHLPASMHTFITVFSQSC